MTSHRLVSAATAATLIVAGLATAGPAKAAAGPAQAAAAEPGLVVDYAHHTVAVRPATIYPYKDLNYSDIAWTSLTAATGSARATRNINICDPDCASGNYTHTQVRLAFTGVVLSDCRPVFSSVTETELPGRRTVTRALPVFPRQGC